jgi:cation diffusion facilitator family transporter
MKSNSEAVIEKRRVALLSVFAAIFLTASKFIIGILTGSLGILSEALHSALDLVAAAITYFSVRISDKPADSDHHYGHGKIENISALIETFLLLITCSWIIYEAVQRLLSGRVHIEINTWSYLVVLTSIIIDFSRSRALLRAAKKYNSQALEADALHFSTDIWSSSVVFLGLICANFGWHSADAIAALIVAMIVIYVSYKLGKRSIDVLLDKAPGDYIKIIEEILRDTRQVSYFHDLKIRTSGANFFVDVSIHVDPTLNIEQVHQIADEIESRIQQKISRSIVHIHQEPEDNSRPE